MRIIITNSGKNILKELSEFSHRRVNSYDDSKYNKSIKDEEEIFFEKANSKNPNFKTIKVTNQKNLNIPPSMVKKYKKKEYNENEMFQNIKSVPNIFTTINKSIDNNTMSSNNNILPIIRTSFPIKYIINPNSYKKLENEVKIQKENLKKTLLTENNFRSVYFEDPIKKFEKSTSSEIKINHRNLIQYLNEDNNITTNYIKELSKFNNNKFIKLNKICQKIFLFKEKDKIIKKHIKEKINQENHNTNKFCKNRLNELKKDLEKSKSILNYEFPKYNKRDRYINEYRNAEKDWIKYNTQRYFSKNSPPKNSANPKQLNINIEEENIDMK